MKPFLCIRHCSKTAFPTRVHLILSIVLLVGQANPDIISNWKNLGDLALVIFLD